MQVNRRDFVKFCAASAAALGLTPADLLKLDQVFAAPNAPSVIWLQGAGCTGCSVSFLNLISPAAPRDAAEVLINHVNLVYHPNVMSAAGEMAVAAAEQAFNTGRYILVVEGAIPTAFGGAACWAWTYGGRDVTFQEAFIGLAESAMSVVAVGTCACFGGIPKAPPNPTAVKGVQELFTRNLINIPGCPAHPDWITWGLVQVLLGKQVQLDSFRRPVALFGLKLHERCPRKEWDETNVWGKDSYCLKKLGCRGPESRSNCPTLKWNGGVNWCVDSNAPCYGCVDPAFPYSPTLRQES